MLYLVGTPIGNMGDFSPRAAEVLSSADIIACEDTRRTGILLKEFGIEGKLFSYHEHNKASKGPILVSRMKEGLTVCLVSDAGMPSISDPGEDLVKLCIEEGIDVSKEYDDIENVVIGYKIKEKRLKMRLSQEELALKVGIDQADLSRIEKGVANPSIKMIYKIVCGLDSKMSINIK